MPISQQLTNVPRPSLCVGREMIHTFIQQNFALKGRPVLLYGLVGMGKTTAALAFAHSHFAQKRYQHIAYFFIKDRIRDAILDNFDLLLNLDIITQTQQLRCEGYEDKAFAFVCERIRKLPGPILIVFDNLKGQVLDLEDLSQFKNRESDLLLTSRKEMPRFDRIEVGKIPENIALDLFCWLHGSEPKAFNASEKIYANHLLHILQHHTLLMHIVACAGREGGYSLSELAQFIQHEHKIFGANSLTTTKNNFWNDQPESPILSYVDHILTAMVELTEQDATCLRYFTTLPNAPQSFDMLKDLFQTTEADIKKLRGSLMRLSRHGILIEQDNGQNDGGRTWALPPMLQEILVNKLQPSQSNCAPLVKRFTQLLQKFLEHGSPIYNWKWVAYSECIAKTFKNGKSKRFYLFFNLYAFLLGRCGRHRTAALFFEKALDLGLTKYEETHPNIAISCTNLAHEYLFLGEIEEAKNLLERALDNSLKNLGPQHPNIAIQCAGLARICHQLGLIEQAKVFLTTAIDVALQNNREAHHSTAQYISMLAHVYHDLGDFGMARELWERALASNLKNLGDKHPNTSIIRTNLACVYYYLREHEKALKLMRKVLGIEINRHENKHPHIAVLCTNVAFILVGLGKHLEAYTFFKKALDMDTEYFGAEHETVARRLSNLDTLYLIMEKQKEPEDKLGEQMEKELKKWGETHPKFATCCYHYALVYLGLNDMKTVRDLWLLALANDLKNLGENHPSIGARYNNIAHAYLATRKQTMAKAFFQNALTLWVAQYGEKHPKVRAVRRSLAALEIHAPDTV